MGRPGPRASTSMNAQGGHKRDLPSERRGGSFLCLNPFPGEGNMGTKIYSFPGIQGLCGSVNTLSSARVQAKRK